MPTYKIIFRNRVQAWVDAKNSELALDRANFVSSKVGGDTALTATKMKDLSELPPTCYHFTNIWFKRQ